MKTKFILFSIIITSLALWANESGFYGNNNMLSDALGYNQKDSLNLGHYFTILQSEYFKPLFFGVLVGVPTLSLIHYYIIGPMIFSHNRKKIYIFTLFNRIIHAIAGISFILIIPTGLMMMFGGFFGGGELIKLAKEIHAISTILFVIAIFPMFIMWVSRMIATMDDLKWLIIVGGYLSKKKEPVPAGKFNAGQKIWFWLATLGGLSMIITGLIMHFQDLSFGLSDYISQINLLRLSAIIHNALGLVVLGFFILHIYMAVFAIKGAKDSMISGYKEEEEVEILHSSYYKELKDENKI